LREFDGEPVGNVRDFVDYFLFPLAIAVGTGAAINILFHCNLLKNNSPDVALLSAK
jgi:hypothetical protein